MLRWTVCVLATALLTGCGPQVVLQPGSAGTETPAPRQTVAVHPDAIWFEVLGVSQQARHIGETALATTARELARAWDRHGFDPPVPAVDFATHVVLLVVRPEDGCPDDLVEARRDGATLQTTFLEPPGGCIEPLIPTAYAIALHRADLPERFTARFEAHEGHGGDITASFTLPAYDGPPAPAPSPPPRQMDPAALAAVFAGHPVRPCAERPDPREGALGGGPSPLQTAHPDFPADIQERYAAEHPDTFGWLLLDSVRDQFAIGVTGDLDGHRERIAARHPQVPFRVEQTPFSQRDLAAAQEAVLAFHDPGHGPQLTASSYLAYLELAVVDPSREDLDAIAAVVDPGLACVDPVLSGVP